MDVYREIKHMDDATPAILTEPIKINNLSVSYQNKPALTGVSLSIQPGTLTGIIGPNGAGKSSLLKGCMGLLKRDAGEVTIGDTPIARWQKEIAYVEQRSAIDLDFPITVAEVVLLGTYPKLGLFRRPKKKEQEKVRASLAKVQMSEFSHRQIGELSGGQLQRVFIARALAQDAAIIFLDEPFVGIDITSEKLIVAILKELKEAGKTIVIVHHDLDKVSDYFDDLVILNKRTIAYGPVSTVFTTKNMQAAYGQTMSNLALKGVAF